MDIARVSDKVHFSREHVQIIAKEREGLRGRTGDASGLPLAKLAGQAPVDGRGKHQQQCQPLGQAHGGHEGADGIQQGHFDVSTVPTHGSHGCLFSLTFLH